MMFRDMWLFIYYCNGINIADLIQLKFNNIIDGEIHFVREKTKRTSKKIKPVIAIITKEMEEIIELWGNENIPENYIFNLVEPGNQYGPEEVVYQKFNQHLRMIGAAVGTQNLTSYSARPHLQLS